MEFKATDEVVVTIPQLHNRTSVLEKAEVIAVHGDKATVILANEEVPRVVGVDCLQHSSEVFGDDTGRPNEMPVLDQIRR